jgi:Tol biopolymer transport system component
MGVKLAIAGLLVLAGGLTSASASGSEQGPNAARSGVVLTSRGGGIVAVNLDGSGVRRLTPPRDDAGDHDVVASPDGSMVAFARAYGYVYVLSADGSGPRRVGPGIEPQWSPDGRWIAASTFALGDARARVYLMRPDGGGATVIGRGEDPAWSSDGRWLAYEGDLRNEEPGVYLVHPDGTGKRRIAGSWDYAWSPNGALVAYVSSFGLWLLDPDTGEQRLLARKRQFGADADPGDLSWSPDGRQIALTAQGYGQGPVYVVPLDGSPPRRVGPPTEEIPVWSPDGTRIAYAVDICCPLDGSGTRLTVIDVATAHRIMTVPPIVRADSRDPVWSPDGSRIAFERGNTAGALGGAADVWSVNPDGTELSRLTDAFPFGGVNDVLRWWPGHDAVAPDPAIATVPLPTTARRQARTLYQVVGVDGTRVALQGPGLTVSFAGGRAPWRRVSAFGASAAFAGARVYWASNDRKESWLYTSARPGAKPRQLRYVAGFHPYFVVQSDRSLVAYSLYKSLWRIRGTRMKRIRSERGDIFLRDVDRERILLQSGNRLELVDARGRLLRSFRSRAVRIRGGALSGRRVVALADRWILVFDARSGRLRAKWPVGAPGVWPFAGFIYKSLLPYSDGSALHVLDVDTGHDLVVRIPQVTEPVGGAITKRGLLYTWTATYSTREGRLGIVPLARLMAAVKAAGRTG